MKKKTDKVGYFDFEAPTQETAVKGGKSALIIAAGLMLAKASMAAMPKEYSKYAKVGVAALGVGIAAVAKDTTVQLIGSGIAALQLTGFISEVAKNNLELKEDTAVNRIVKAGLGMNGSAKTGLAAISNEDYIQVSEWYPEYDNKETIDLKKSSAQIYEDVVYG